MGLALPFPASSLDADCHCAPFSPLNTRTVDGKLDPSVWCPEMVASLSGAVVFVVSLPLPPCVLLPRLTYRTDQGTNSPMRPSSRMSEVRRPL